MWLYVVRPNDLDTCVSIACGCAMADTGIKPTFGVMQVQEEQCMVGNKAVSGYTCDTSCHVLAAGMLRAVSHSLTIIDRCPIIFITYRCIMVISNMSVVDTFRGI